MCFWIQAMHSIWTTGKWSQPFWWWTSPVSNHWKLLCATMAHENKNILLVLTVLTEIKFIIHTFTLLFDDILHTVPNSFKNKKPSPPKKKTSPKKSPDGCPVSTLFGLGIHSSTGKPLERGDDVTLGAPRSCTKLSRWSARSYVSRGLDMAICPSQTRRIWWRALKWWMK